ncbi:hypothetical protein ABN028_19530 [Actinopolymorpha sp. B17G11]|uniref:hypothetical protein n=1 Tax=Actinopolymorpha sp. B17G11 TaxID=3160861 RepID=UPI0032E3C2EF
MATTDTETSLAELMSAAGDIPGDDAYDGSNAPQTRDLTARERDVLCRILNFVITDPRYRYEDLARLAVIRDVIDPRRDVPHEPVSARSKRRGTCRHCGRALISDGHLPALGGGWLDMEYYSPHC